MDKILTVSRLKLLLGRRRKPEEKTEEEKEDIIKPARALINHFLDDGYSQVEYTENRIVSSKLN